MCTTCPHREDESLVAHILCVCHHVPPTRIARTNVKSHTLCPCMHHQTTSRGRKFSRMHLLRVCHQHTSRGLQPRTSLVEEKHCHTSATRRPQLRPPMPNSWHGQGFSWFSNSHSAATPPLLRRYSAAIPPLLFCGNGIFWSSMSCLLRRVRRASCRPAYALLGRNASTPPLLRRYSATHSAISPVKNGIFWSTTWCLLRGVRRASCRLVYALLGQNGSDPVLNLET